MNPDSAPPPFHPDADAEITLHVQPGQRLELQVRSGATGDITVSAVPYRWWHRYLASEWTIFIAAFLLSGMMLVGLSRYPLQVAPAEVYPSLRAADLIQNDFKGEGGTLLPAFLSGATPYEIGASAYLQVLPQFFRPNSLVWIRSFNGLLGLLAMVLLAAWLRNGLRVKYPWLVLLLLASSPAWFTLSRSGLDIALAAALLTGALSCYGIYRSGQVKFILPSAVLAMLAFYAAPAARLAVPFGMGLLLLVDARYHWQQRRWTIRALGLTGLLLLPLIRFFFQHPSGIIEQLQAAGSYLAADLGFWEKAGKFVLAALNVFNPLAWFIPDPNLPPMVQPEPYAALSLLIAPFIYWGGWAALKNFHQPAYRLIWIGLLAAAVGAAPFGGKLPETLPAVPALIIFALLGLRAAVGAVARHWKRLPAWLPGWLLLTVTGGGAVLLLLTALNAGTHWTVDYGREGIQFGPPQIFAAAKSYASTHPQRTVLVWPEWSSDPDAMRRFFAPGMEQQIQLGYVDNYLYSRQPDLDQKAFILPAEQTRQLQASGKFVMTPVTAIAYPNGQPAFDLVELRYTAELEKILAKETEIRHQLIAEDVEINGQIVKVSHSRLDIGIAVNLFDAMPDSLVRTAEANPLVIELTFPQPVQLNGVAVEVGAEPIRLTVSASSTDGRLQTRTAGGSAGSGMKTLQVDFGETLAATQLRIEVLDTAASEPAHVHVWEIRFIGMPE